MNLTKKRKSCKQKFLTPKKYNKIVKKRDGNCLSFAFGITSNNCEDFDLLTKEQCKKVANHQKIEDVDICEAFVNKAKEFGYNVRQLSPGEDAKGKVIFILLGWYSEYIKPFGTYKYMFHVIRRNEDYSFEHKKDWFNYAESLTPYEVYKFLNLPYDVHYFALEDNKNPS